MNTDLQARYRAAALTTSPEKLAEGFVCVGVFVDESINIHFGGRDNIWANFWNDDNDRQSDWQSDWVGVSPDRTHFVKKEIWEEYTGLKLDVIAKLDYYKQKAVETPEYARSSDLVLIGPGSDENPLSRVFGDISAYNNGASAPCSVMEGTLDDTDYYTETENWEKTTGLKFDTIMKTKQKENGVLNIYTAAVPEVAAFVKTLAESKGLFVGCVGKAEKFWHLFTQVGENRIYGYDHEEFAEHCGETATKLQLGEFISVLESFPTPPPTVKLPGILKGYDLEIKEDGLHAGCQTISFENFEKIAAAMKAYPRPEKISE